MRNVTVMGALRRVNDEELVAAPLCGQRLCSVLLSGDSFIINQMSILSYCAQTELNDCPDHHVMVNLH